MAFPISISDLDRETSALMSRELEIQPVDASVEGRVLPDGTRSGGFRGRGGGRGGGRRALPPFAFYSVDRDRGELRIPLGYAKTHFEVPDGDDPRWAPMRITTKSAITLRSHQTEILEEAETGIRGSGSEILEVNTAAGKTIMAIHHALKFGLKTIIIAPITTLITQWRKSIGLVAFGDEDSPELARAVWIAPEPSKPEPKTARGRAKRGDPAEADFILAMPGRVEAIPYDVRRSLGMMILDEAHFLCTEKQVGALLAVCPKHVLALTATMRRDDGQDRMLDLIVHGGDNPHVQRFNPREYDVRPIATGVRVPEVPNTKSSMGGMDYSEYSKAISESGEFTQAVVAVIADTLAANRKVMVITPLAAHVAVIGEAAAAAVGESRVETFYGGDSVVRDRPVIVGTPGKMGTGFDMKMKCDLFSGVPADTLILTHTIKKWQAYTQFAGRVMRAPDHIRPEVYLMMTRNRISAKHLDALRPVMEMNKATVHAAVPPPCLSKT